MILLNKLQYGQVLVLIPLQMRSLIKFSRSSKNRSVNRIRQIHVLCRFISIYYERFYLVFAECSLASFGTGAGVQRIPFVYLPLKGQIIHPSKDITFQGKT